MASYEAMVFDEIATLTREKVCIMLSNLEGLVFDDDVSHLIIMAAPDRANRRQFTLFIASHYLTDRILERLKTTDNQAASHLY